MKGGKGFCLQGGRLGACMHVCIEYGGMFLSLTKAQADGCKVRKP